MSRPTHTLKHEHRIIEQALRALDGMCTRLELGEEIPAEALVQMLDFVQIYADRFHHEKEEMHLFPALQKNGMQVEGGPLGFLQQEHQMERKLLIDLGSALTDYRNGAETAKQRIIEIARNYSRHLLSHMRREDSILFMLAEEMLDETTKSSINYAFAKAEHGLGEKTVEHYEQMAMELERAWAV
ncbi:MAG TPA: hemerythrin domain-containing protein [Blastocatellia bacterium]|nr:hemerythrin domain-containing protein [Blastocatellia bacterium]